MIKQKLHTFKSHLLCSFVGFSITLLSTIGAWFYYNTPEEVGKDYLFYKVANALHTSTIDLKTRIQGYKLEDRDLAVVAIDERSLESYGRWPWSRATVARLVDELFANGVKAVGLDITFSESSNEEIQSVLKELPKLKSLTPHISPQGKKVLKTYSQRKQIEHDADGRLVEQFNKYENQLVAASVYNIPRHTYHPYQMLCYHLLYRKTSAYNVWEKEGYDFIHLLADQDVEVFEELPIALEKFTEESLQRTSQRTTSNFCKKFEGKGCPEQLSPMVRIRMEKEIGEAQREYCSHWLDPAKDDHWTRLQSLWPRLSKSDPELRGQSFDEFIKRLKTSGLNSALRSVDYWTVNIDRIHEAARHTGFLNVHPDIDGTIRKIPLLARTGPHIIPSLAVRLAMSLTGADGGQISLQKNALNPRYFEIKDMELTKDAEVIHDIVTDREGYGRLNFRGPRYAYPHISAKEILEPKESSILITQLKRQNKKLVLDRNLETPKSFLKGKTVILGATAIGLYDLRVTPFDENYPGVEGHLTMLDNIISKDLLSTPRDEPVYMLLILLVIGIFLSVVLSLVGALPGLFFSAIIIGGAAIIDYFYFFKSSLVTTISFPLLLSFTLYLSLTIFKYFTEERKKRVLRGTFEKYVSPAIVNEIMQHPDNLRLGGRKEHMTVFFSDVRGFTTISEALDPRDLSDLLNVYLTPMTELVFANNGTLDKYMGDAIMAFFGAPVTSQTHATDACRCALQNIEKLNELNVQLKEKNLPEIDIGIGVNTGDMSVGNMGSQTVRSYTVMGDAVNLGARLEGINKQYGTRIILSEFTEKELDDQFVRREIDWVKVKGKEKPVRIFELIAEGDIPDQKKEMLTHFRRGFHLYHQQKWESAIDELKTGMEHVPGDPVSKLYLQRCHEFLSHPPDGDWDGVFTMKTK